MKPTPLLILFMTPLALRAAVTHSGFTDPNPSPTNQFGAHVVPLANGNVVVTAPGDNAGGQNAGAVYLFNGATADLISTLTGSSTNDSIGSNGVVALPNGNFVVLSPTWDNGAIQNAGAVTWVHGGTGISGAISAANSLVGSSTDDLVGAIHSVKVLANGNYVVSSTSWNNGAVADAGAATWGSATSGVSGTISVANSLIGDSAGDAVGGDVVALPGGNYVVVSSSWANGSDSSSGAVTWGNGSSGVKGVVAASNSLVGANGSVVGNGGITILSNGNYVVSSPECWRQNVATAGAATWGSATAGVKGAVSTSNSLMGTRVNDRVSSQGITVLTNGNYVVNSPEWDNGSNENAGAATWGDGDTGVKGAVAASNSLVGNKPGDYVGNPGAIALTNGNYVVGSVYWTFSGGAATWGDGSSGVKGVVSLSNSFTGTLTGDGAGSRITALANGHYVVTSGGFDNGPVQNVGAVTWGNGNTGLIGSVNAANSLVGTNTGDLVGASDVVALSNGNFVVASEYFRNGGVNEAGAVTWCNGSGPVIGVVSASNSLVGSTAADSIGRRGTVRPLAGGNYLVISSKWDRNGTVDVGAATWGSGTTGVSGEITPSNSLVGSTQQDEVGENGAVILSNGNYVVSSRRWGDALGALTWGSAASGLSGEISADNSLIGTRSGDDIGDELPVPLSNGNYVVGVTNWHYFWDSFTLGSGSSALTGQVHHHPSGFVRGDGQTSVLPRVIPDDVNGVFYCSVPDAGKIIVGSQTTGFPTTTAAVERLDGTPLASGSVLDFGPVATNTALEIPVKIRNAGQAPLVLPNVAMHQESGPFSVNYLGPVVLDPGASITATVKLQSTQLGDRTGLLKITSNSSSSPDFSLNLKGRITTFTEAAYSSFTSAAGLQGDDAADDATPHDDGVANLLKFAFNMDASKPDHRMLEPGGSSGLPRCSVVEEFGQTWLQVEYIAHYSNVMLTYTPKWSASLAPGSFVAMTGPVSQYPLPQEGWKRVIARQSINPAIHTRRFAIVEVTK
ncbi:hypothetical protein [Haloferula sp. BvORR071]|uniref:Ig-like domain-containing protein n=1 Tax=Haloferula sp. BvORR071 TaxID=1396141 RepID=UPI0005522D79|nr:hypothetical protein [Haloferula sp. BvORR071]